MRVFITGATGFIGRALTRALQRENHTVVAWVRSAERARSLIGADISIVPIAQNGDTLAGALGRCDAVVNLAGESILAGRWTTARRRRLTESRVGLTERLVAALASLPARPRVLVSSSAVGYYGNRADDVLTEGAAPGDDFLARLCVEWEAAANAARRFGVRVVLVRTGVVLGKGGGALARMLPPFRLGLGGPIGSGRQFLPWIHLEDLMNIIGDALADARYEGPINGVAPQEATSREFAQALGRALHRPALLPTPAFALRTLFGEAASVLLDGQRVRPERLRELGFSYAFPTLERALGDIFR